MATVGEILRRERQRQGHDLATIAVKTRIKHQFLEALESDNFDSLPGKFFARSFTTQYADWLGINTPELQAALQRQISPVVPNFGEGKGTEKPLWEEPEYAVDPLPEGTASAVSARKMWASVMMLVAVVIACGSVFWLWQRSQLSSTSASEPPPTAVVSEPPRITPQVPAPQETAPPATQVTTPPQNEPKPAEPAKTEPPKTTPVPEVKPPQAVATPVIPANSELLGTLTDGRIKLVLTAKEDTWVRVISDGKVVAARVIPAGSTRTAIANEGASILLGNAGGLSIRYNGTEIPQPGPRGQVRTVEFTPQGSRVIEPKKVITEETEQAPPQQ